MAKPIVAHKHRGLQNCYCAWIPFHDYRYVIYGIANLGPVQTTSGPMVKVRLKKNVELININQDVTALVGRLLVADKVYSNTYFDLFYWEDKYWLKALDSNSEWYKGQCNLLYEVNVQVTDDYIELLAVERNRILESKKAVV